MVNQGLIDRITAAVLRDAGTDHHDIDVRRINENEVGVRITVYNSVQDPFRLSLVAGETAINSCRTGDYLLDTGSMGNKSQGVVYFTLYHVKRQSDIFSERYVDIGRPNIAS